MSKISSLAATAFRRMPKHRRLSMERHKRFRTGALATLLSQLIGTGGQLLLVPIFLTYWGQGLYGEWLTLAAATAYLAVLDFGVQMYVVNRLNACFTRGELRTYTRVLHSALSGSLAISIVAFAVIAGIAFLAPLDRMFGFEQTTARAATIVVCLLGLQVIAAVPQGIVRGIYRTVGEYPRGTMVANLQRLGHVSLTAAAVVTGGGLVAVAGAQLVPLVAVVGFVLFDVKKRHPEIEIGIQERDWKLAMTFLGPSFLFFLLQAAMVTALQGSTILVGVVLGAGHVALFATTRTLANLIRQLTSILTNALWPELTMLQAQGQADTMRRVHLLSVKVITLMSLMAAIFLQHCGADVFTLWTQGSLGYDAELMRAFLIVLVVQTPWMTSMFVLIASNNHHRLSALWFAASLIGLALGALLLPTYGPAGLVYGLGIAELALCGFTVPRLSCKLIGQRYGEFITRVLFGGALFCLCNAMVVDALLDGLPAMAPLVRVFVVGVVSTVFTGVAGYLFWLDSSEAQRVRGLLTAPFKS